MIDYSQEPEVSTSTLEFLVGKTVDTVLNWSPATMFFLGNQKKWAGSRMRFPIKYASNTQGMWFTGLEKFSTTATSNFINMEFDPTGREINSVMSQREVDINETNKVIDIIARRMASDAQDMASDIATSFYTLQTGNAFLSLFDACDDGTLGASSYGGLSRTTYSGLAGNYVAIGGNLTLANMRTEYNLCTHGPEMPNLLLTGKTIWGYYEKLLTPTLSNQITAMAAAGYAKFTGADGRGVPNIVAPGTPLRGAQGFNTITYAGVPVVADETLGAIQSGYLLMLNTKSINFYGIPTKKEGYQAVKFYSDTMDSVYNVPVTTGFSFSGFNTPIDQYGSVGHIILQGNLICDNPRLNGVMVTITGS